MLGTWSFGCVTQGGSTPQPEQPGTDDDDDRRDAGTVDAGTVDGGTREGGEDGDGGTSDDAGRADAEPPLGQPCDLDDGECIFRFDTFGDELLWTDVLRLHELVETLPPTAALGVGLKVDADAVPAEVLASADLEDPATTLALLELDAVIGVRADVEDGEIRHIGITCALCHSTVDDSALPGVGRRLDGHPNRDLNVGAILSLLPGLDAYAAALEMPTDTVRAALESWGPGRYDARFNLDGISHPVLLPPAYGLRDVELETYTGDGPVSYWNAYVAVTQMGGQGSFSDPRIGLDIEADPDLVTPKLPALRDYQFSLEPPAPPEGSFDAEAATRGQALFEGEARCSTCHPGPTYTDAPNLHEPSETGMEPLEAERSATGLYRATPLRGA